MDSNHVDMIRMSTESDPDIEADESKETILADFRQAWHEAMTGQTVLASQIWEGIEIAQGITDNDNILIQST
jgi:hypothetical protein